MKLTCFMPGKNKKQLCWFLWLFSHQFIFCTNCTKDLTCVLLYTLGFHTVLDRSMFQIKTQMFTVDESPVVLSRVFSLLILSVLCFGVYYKHEFPSALCTHDEYMRDMMDIKTGTNTYTLHTTNCKQP